jgi:soluble lytic murein transglycosylase-like protein
MKLAHACAAFAAAAFVASGPRAAPATRYECRMLDGSLQVAMEDLSGRFRAAVRGCVAIHSPQLPDDAPAPLAGGRIAALPDPFFASDATAGPARSALLAPAQLQRMVDSASRRYGLDPRLVSALVRVESGFQAHARSPKGALGLMQIMPATGSRYGAASARDLLDPATNIDVGSRYLRDLHGMFDGRIELVLAAYNAGEGAVRRYGNRIPPYAETREYVRKILALYQGR